jgi:hypothetical protein
MRRLRLAFGFCLLGIAGCAPQPGSTVTQASAPPLAPGQGRVWVLRQQDPPGGNIDAADPMVSANGAPIGQSRQGTVFFHDFPPGSYRFTVQPYGTPTGQSLTVQLAAGMQTYLQVQAVPNWQLGSSVGGYSFTVLATSPEVAQQYLPTLTLVGGR